MYITSIPNRTSPPCILLRESYRVGKKVHKRTVANLSKWDPRIVAGLQALLKGGKVIEEGSKEDFEVSASVPHGHIGAVLGVMKNLELPTILSSQRSRERDLVMGMIVARIINPGSKLATARGINGETQFTSLGEALGIAEATEDELYGAMDWLVARQERIEKKLAGRHLRNGTLVLYDVTSTYFEGRSCPLAQYGVNRDGKNHKLQIVFGLLCDGEGRPVATEVFEGNTADPKTLGTQIGKIRERFGLERVVVVGDRGMLTDARINEEIKCVEGLHWITALRAPAIQELVKRGSLQLSLFDEQDLAEITSPEYPGERLIVCRNPLLATDRRRTREELLQATEQELGKITAAVSRETRPLRGKEKIGLRVGKIINRYKMSKHFLLTISDDSFQYARDTEKIAEEARLDGFYVIRTSVPKETLTAAETVAAYKGLSRVERAFRSMKTVDLQVRPIYHHLSERVRAHVFLCMLAYYVEWHMRKALAPILFQDDDPAAGQAVRGSVVAPAVRSLKARRKAATKRTEEGFPVLNFRGVFDFLATIVNNTMQPRIPGAPSFRKMTTPNRYQQHILDLLGVRL